MFIKFLSFSTLWEWKIALSGKIFIRCLLLQGLQWPYEAVLKDGNTAGSLNAIAIHGIRGVTALNLRVWAHAEPSVHIPCLLVFFLHGISDHYQVWSVRMFFSLWIVYRKHMASRLPSCFCECHTRLSIVNWTTVTHSRGPRILPCGSDTRHD